MRPAPLLRPRSLLLAAGCLGLFAAAGLVRDDLTRAADRHPLPGPSRTPQEHGILRLSATGKILPAAVPTVDRATLVDRGSRANRLGEARERDLKVQCRPDTLDVGRWCVMRSALVGGEERSYAEASRACIDRGGWLPSVAQLAGVADRVTLAAGEMAGTLITTEAGSSAAGTSGPTKGSKGDPKQGEPDPVPLPAEPEPESLQYVLLLDRGAEAGFAGARSVGQKAPFRCAFVKGGQGPTTARKPAASAPAGPAVSVGALARVRVSDLAGGKVKVRLRAADVAQVRLTLRGRVRSRPPGSRKTVTGGARTLATAQVTLQPARERAVALRPSAAVRALLRRRGAAVLDAQLEIVARDTAGRALTQRKDMPFTTRSTRVAK